MHTEDQVNTLLYNRVTLWCCEEKKRFLIMDTLGNYGRTLVYAVRAGSLRRLYPDGHTLVYVSATCQISQNIGSTQTAHTSFWNTAVDGFTNYRLVKLT